VHFGRYLRMKSFDFNYARIRLQMFMKRDLKMD